MMRPEMTESETIEFATAEALDREGLARAVAAAIPVKTYVNLGIGLPTRVAHYLDGKSLVVLHTENGMLGMGPEVDGELADPDLVNAGKHPVLELPGAAYFDHASSFAMMRGGHLDVCVLGAFQVSRVGDLANWTTGEPDSIPAVGGAMDLAVGAKAVFVMMTLFDRHGTAKLVERCSYPLTAPQCVARIFTDFAQFSVVDGVLVVDSTHGIGFAELEERLGMTLRRRAKAVS